MTPDEKKKAAAQAALEYVESGWVIGIGTGSTANHFIGGLAKNKGKLEKIIAAGSRKFVCIADDSKLVDVLGKFPLPVEVIPMARSLVARKIVELGGSPG